jgi:hypothetical protein
MENKYEELLVLISELLTEENHEETIKEINKEIDNL